MTTICRSPLTQSRLTCTELLTKDWNEKLKKKHDVSVNAR